MIKIDEVERNRNVFLLINRLLEEKRFDEIVMLGEILIGDKHPSILKSYHMMTSMCENENVIKISQKIEIKLKQLLNIND
jgi:hypothetical protein